MEPMRRLASVTDVAQLLNIDKAAASRRISRLENEGSLDTHIGHTEAGRRQKLVDLDQFDAATANELSGQKLGAKTLNGGDGPLPATERAAKTLTEANIENAQLRAEMTKHKLAELRGQVLQISDVADGMTRCAGAIVRVIEQLPTRAPDLASMASTAGERGVRNLLRTISLELREVIAREMTAIASELKVDRDE